MRVLVLGGYGLIGSSILRALLADGHDVVGLGRSKRRGAAFLPEADWVQADIATLQTAEHWRPLLQGVEGIVNASGVLQDGLGDTVVATQETAILALIEACREAGVRTFIQISVPGASPASPTSFYRSKALADAALARSGLSWTILRPGLVLAPQAYGGSALLRMLAAVPVLQPVALGTAQIRTVAVNDVARAVALSIEGAHAGGDFDLVETSSQPLERLLLRLRAWFGFPPPRAILRLPLPAVWPIAWLADLAGHLGWRSALRTNALKALAGGITGTSGPWTSASGLPLKSLEETLAAMPATRQERIFARAALVFPILVLTQAGFWTASGIIGVLRMETAAGLLSGALGPESASGLVLAGSLTDCAIGLSTLVRPLLRPACLAAILVACAYLIGASLFMPALWLDPLGSLVKVFPALALALAVLALAEER
ncbi:MAG: NAD(P)H-binding protein [Alphaproteobacteria bacterium]|nr:NAD(P)H-binding protein [Alphaproteobacteria bacterium]